MNRTVQDIYPLSPTQRGLLFHSLYGPQSGVYVVQVCYTLQGPLNREAFTQAWQQLLARHTILRTAFVWDNLEAPVQVVGRRVSFPIDWQDWQDLPPSAQQQRFTNWLASDRQMGFNLSTAPLMRLTVCQWGPDCHRIGWTHHHILLDGWSLPILLREWLVYYRAACTQQVPQLEPSHPYREYIAWLQQQNLEQAKAFWQVQLAGMTAPTPLGIDQAPAGLSAAHTQVQDQQFSWTVEQTQRLKSFAQQHRVTLSTVIQGAWAKILSCYSGDPAVVYGLACGGRPSSLPHADGRVGLFINTLPMRIEVAPDHELVPWLQQLQSQQLALQPYEYTPLVEIRAVSPVPHSLPLFESVVVVENYPLAPRQGMGKVELVDVAVVEQTHYPLTLFAVVTETLTLKVLSDPQRFSQAAMTRLLGHLQTVLSQMIQGAPAGVLQDITLLSPAEQQQLRMFGRSRTAIVHADRVDVAIAQQAAQHPDATAVISNSIALSYGQLNQRANQLAHYLRHQGIGPGTFIGLCLRRSIDMVVALLAILKAGCAYVPLDPTFPAARLRDVASNAQLNWIICQAETAAAVGDLEAQPLNLSRIDAAVQQQPAADPCQPTHPDDFAYLIYTSGSTGQPKGVPIQHRSLSNLLGAMAARLHIRASDTFMAVTTLAFDIAALELFLPLANGARLLLASDDWVRDGHQLIAHLDAYGVNLMQATPATWRLLVNSGWGGQSGLRILCGGEALDIDLARQLCSCAEEVWNVYGPTETTIWSSALALAAPDLAGGLVPIGAPIDHTQFYVLDQQQQPVPIGVAGELYIGGIGLTPGYWQAPQLTAAKFMANPFGDKEDSPAPTLYRTGDRVRYREEGTLDYLGRLDQQTKLRGYRIELGEIEGVLATYPPIRQAVVMIRGDAPLNQRLVAYVTQAQETDHATLARELRSHLSQQLPPYMIPSTYQVLEAFPLTPNGKVDRQALPAPVPPAAAADHQPQTSLETTLAQIWRSLLQREAIRIDDNFFEVGGHSLLVVNAQIQIRQQLGMELTLMDLFRYPTIRTLAARIGEQQGKEADPSDRTAVLTAGKQRLKQQLQQRRKAAQVGGGAP